MRYAAAALAFVGVLLPANELAVGLAYASSPGAQKDYWSPLAAELGGLPGAADHRLEVVPPAGHWEVQYLSSSVSLARGWERQTDEALNPLFYGRASLTADTYRAWLDDLAVAYVALPDGPLDWSAADEAVLLAGSVPYLSLVWHNEHWKVFAVDHPTPMVLGPGRLLSMGGGTIAVSVTSTEPVVIRLRWSSYLTYVGPPGCLSPAGEWTSLRLQTPGVATLRASWRPTGAQVDELCPPDSS
jgi:hypothetical protein